MNAPPRINSGFSDLAIFLLLVGASLCGHGPETKRVGRNNLREVGRRMPVSRRGNSMAVRLTSAMVEALGPKQGGQIEMRIVEKRSGARAQAARSFACGVRL